MIEANTLWKIVDSNHSREDLIYSQAIVSERLLFSNIHFLLREYSENWASYPEMELNHHHLYVRQIRSHYAIGANKINNCYQDLNVAQNTYWRPPIGYDD